MEVFVLMKEFSDGESFYYYEGIFSSVDNVKKYKPGNWKQYSDGMWYLKVKEQMGQRSVMVEYSIDVVRVDGELQHESAL